MAPVVLIAAKLHMLVGIFSPEAHLPLQQSIRDSNPDMSVAGGSWFAAFVQLHDGPSRRRSSSHQSREDDGS